MQEAKKGDRISLDLNKRLYYFQGDEGINLSEINPTTVIPDNIGERELKQINMALRIGHLVIGWEPEKKIEIPEDKFVGDILSNGRNKVTELIHQIKNDKYLKNEEKITKLNKLLELEKLRKNRVSVIKNIERILEDIPGISQVIETEKEELKIDLIKGNSEPKEEDK